MPGVVANYGRGWAGEMYPYIDNAGVYRCPNDISPDVSPTNMDVSYAFNVNLGGNTSGKLASKQTAPALTVSFFEVTQNFSSNLSFNVTSQTESSDPVGNGGANDNYLPNVSSAYGGYETGQLAGYTKPNGFFVDANYPNGRHSQGSNFIFCDGHVKWMKGSMVSAGENATEPSFAEKTDPTTSPQYINAAGTGSLSATESATFSF